MRQAPPSLSEAEIERRMPLWIALADLYLDTQSDMFVPNVVQCASEGGFSLADVDHILRWEVRPALYLNYLNLAGEWAGWPSDWLKDRILSSMRSRPSLLIGKNRFMPEEWSEIQRAMGD